MITTTCPTAFFSEDKMVFALSGNEPGYARIEYYYSNRPVTQDSAYIVANGRYAATNIYEGIVHQMPVELLNSTLTHCLAYRPASADISFFFQDGFAQANFLIFNGKSSESLHSTLIAQGTSLAERKINGQSSPLLSTKTSTSLISMRESEICPLFFMPKPEGNNSYIVKNASGTTLLSVNDATPALAVSMVSLPVLLSQFGERFFTIEWNGYPIHVAIENNRPSMQTRVITFRNSYGVFEKLALTGKASASATLADSTFSQFNPITQSFELRQSRRQITHTIKAYAGYKNKEELYFILDMLNSDEVYLSDIPEELGIRVMPSVLEYNYFNDMDEFEPREVELAFKPAIGDSAFTPL